MDFMDFSRRLYRWASEGVDMYVNTIGVVELDIWAFPP